jgi:ribosome-binding protein aMBF1 (putative translation factor)
MTEPARDLAPADPSVLDYDHPGLWIQEQCRRLGLTPTELAREAKLSPSTVCRWVRQDTEPDTYSLRKINRVVSFWATREEKNR